jgi:hypothetical protein
MRTNPDGREIKTAQGTDYRCYECLHCGDYGYKFCDVMNLRHALLVKLLPTDGACYSEFVRKVVKGKFGIGRAAYVKFSWLPRRLTLKCNVPIYHWLWWNFGWSDAPRVIPGEESK